MRALLVVAAAVAVVYAARRAARLAGEALMGVRLGGL